MFQDFEINFDFSRTEISWISPQIIFFDLVLIFLQFLKMDAFHEMNLFVMNLLVLD